MTVVDFRPARAAPIPNFGSVLADSVRLGDGEGEAHVYFLRIAAGGSIGRHPAGFDQLFLVVEGSGGVVGGDGRRVALAAGQGARFEKGEDHAKGSDAGLAAVMVQVERLRPAGG
jgi:mannose-6-phosphate isomerase-like protein (cupin superfamily)